MSGFLLDETLTELRNRVRRFVDEEIIPKEATIESENADGRRDTLHALQQQVKELGLWTPHLPVEHGGLGLGVMGMCALFREMGRSPFGAKCFNCDAPDQGNMDLLIKAASDAIKNRYLKPLCAGDVTSAFCMTEPAPGAGADPQNLRTKATQEGADWVLDGHKWYSTGGENASFLIVMARTSDDPRRGASLFVVDKDAPGVEFVRRIPVMGPDMLDHLETEFRFNQVRLSQEALLGGVGDGFLLAQRRLVPARLTHCMRWLGLMDRTLAMCRGYINERVSFGRPLIQHQAIQKMIADGATAIHSGNLMTLHCAQLLESGRELEARTYSSMSKNHIAKSLCKILDDAIQMHGGLGYSEDIPFSKWYRTSRAARLADGPDEIHDMVISRDFMRERVNLLV